MLRATARALFLIVAVAGTGASEAAEGLGTAQLILSGGGSREPVRLDTARLHVHVELMPGMALVQFDQSFYNPHTTQDEGVVAINLPAGASVSRFAAFHDHELLEAELIDRRYSGGIRSSRDLELSDPDAFEQIGSNLFRIPVYLIPGRGIKRILLDYTVPLHCEDKRYRFTLPLRTDGKPIWDFRLTGKLHPPVEQSSIKSPTHKSLELTPLPDGGAAFDLRGEHRQPEPAFTVEYGVPTAMTAIVRSFQAPDPENDDQRWQHLAITIPSEQSAPLEPLPADVLLLADTSGSMRNLELLRSAVRSTIEHLRVQDRFQLGCVDSSFRPLTDEWMTAGPESAHLVEGMLGRQFPLGASELHDTLPAALRLFEEATGQRRQVVIYFGDGVGTERLPGFQWPGVLSADGPRFTAVQVGADFAGREMLREAIRRTGGRFFQVQHNGHQLGDLVGWVHAGLTSARRIQSVEIDGVDEVDLFHDPSWLPGRPLEIHGRRRPDETVQVTLRLADELEARRYELTPDEGSGDGFFTGRSWAQRKLARLLARERPFVDEDRNRIVKLSQEWGVQTPHTAFLMLNGQSNASGWSIEPQLRRRYWSPPRTLAPLMVPEQYRAQAVPPRTGPADDGAEPPQPIRERFEQGFADARDALDASEAEEALRILSRMHTWDSEFDRERFHQLYTETSRVLANERLRQSLGLRQGLVDRSARLDLLPGEPDLFAVSFRPVSPEFLKHFPYGQQMIRQLSPPARDYMPLNKLAEYIGHETGLNVVLDERNLLDEGISVDEEVDLHGIKRITVRNLLNTVLQNVAGVSLDYEFEEEVLRITTGTIAEEWLETVIYNVPDLVATDVPPQPGFLTDPFREIERAAQERVRSRLRQPISVHFPGNPLSEVVEYFRDHLDTNVRLDVQNLLDEGISPDEEVAISVDDVPAGSVLNLLLENVAGVALDWVNENEVVTITTATIAEERLQTRLYPLSGILYEYPEGTLPERKRYFHGLASGSGSTHSSFHSEASNSSREPSAGGYSRIGPLATGDDTAGEEEVVSWDGFGFDDGFGSSSEGVGANIDFDEIIELIQNETSGPWFWLDGIGGTISEYPEALSIMVRTTGRVHDEIEEMLRALRELPQADHSVRPARVPHVTADQNSDMDALIDLIQNETSGPWFDLDGIGGSITEHLPSRSLFIRQTRRNHEEAFALLAELRQARSVAEHYDETGELVEFEDLGLIGRDVSVTRLPTLTGPDQLPPPGDAELALLNSCRAEPREGSQRWSHDAGDVDSPNIAVALEGDRLQMTLDGHVLRAAGERAALAYPGLTLVEIGTWGEAVRQLLDTRLPWLPHRTNRELARLFSVTQHAADDDSVTLNLVFPTGSAHLLASFDRQTRRIVSCAAYLDGQLQHRLDIDRHEGGPTNVVLQDAEGTVTESWTSTDHAPASVPALTNGWEGYLIDNLLDETSPFRRARQALQVYDYAGAEALLRNGLLHQPEQPLLSLSLAWMHEYLPYDELARIEQRQLLEQVVRTAGPDLVEQISPLNFPSLTDREFYFLLLEQPVRTRTAESWDRLTELALRQSRYTEALEHLHAALEATDGKDARALRERNLVRVQLLLLLERDAAADAAATDLLAEQGESLENLVRLAELFGAAGHIATADGYFGRALQRDGLSDNQRRRLLSQQATWHSGVSRWRLLLQAAELRPDDDGWRHQLVKALNDEMNTSLDASVAADLSSEAGTAEIEVALKLRQAELTPNAKEAAAIGLSLFQSNQLPTDRFEWMVDRLIHAGRFDEAIDILEASLREGERLNGDLRRHLAAAYVATGRPQDGLRADSQVEEEREPPEPPEPPGRGSFSGGGFFSVEQTP